MREGPIFHLEHLTYWYGDPSQGYKALDDLCLKIHPGEFVAITGPSGSGKSTLMALLGALAMAKDGALMIDGQVPSEMDARALSNLRNRTIGFVFQQFHLLPRLTVLENVLLPCQYVTPRPSIREDEEWERRALTLLGRLGIRSERDKYPAQLSGGQKQRVALARALLLRPKVILADEPTGALDSRTAAEVMEQFQELHRAGSTIIVITHDPEVAMMAERQVVLRDGRIAHDKIYSDLQNRDPQGRFRHDARDGSSGDLLLRDLLLGDLLPKDDHDTSTSKGRRAWAALRRFWRPFGDAWAALASAKLRTSLTALGLVIGVASITMMITLGRAAQDVIMGIFNQAGSDRVYVGLNDQAMRQQGLFYWSGLSLDRDVPALQRVFAKYGRVVPFGETLSQKIMAGGRSTEARVEPIFSREDALDKGLQIKKGRMFAPHEWREGAPVALVGPDFVEQMFPAQDGGRLRNPNFPIGERLAMRGELATTMTVIGVLDRRDATFEAKDLNSRVYIPLATLTRYTGQKNATWIAVVPREGVGHRWLADAVTNYLRLATGLKFPFEAHVPEEMITKIMLFVTVFQSLTGLIGGLCMVVGGIGIMNIMLVTIAERIKEIGLRKAIGASDVAIKRQFLIESTFLCAISGLIGVVIGLLFCNGVAYLGHTIWPNTVPGRLLLNKWGIGLGLATGVGSGMLFGLMPALKAARLDPSEALRHE